MPLPFTHLVDLTHRLTPDFPSYDGSREFSLKPLATLEADGWNYNAWTLAEHIGTHFDAPRHRGPGPAADEIPVTSLVGPLVVVDLRSKAALNPDAGLESADLVAWEETHGPIPQNAVVAMLSGWEARLNGPGFRNADAAGRMHFPGFSAAATEWLLRERTVVGLAVDTLSLDPGLSQEFPTHALWLGAGRWGLECVANLGAVPMHGATIIVGAPKVAGASGGPARVLAGW